MKKYDSYKDSGVEWIGKIPTNWKSKRFSYSIDIQKGKIPKNLTDEKLIDSLPYLSMGVLRGDKPMEFSNENGIVHVSKGDIGLLWDGSNSGEVIRINREGILSSTVSLLSLKDDSIDKEFCFYLLKFYENDFRENTIGMGIPHVSGDHVRESKLIIPPISEQQQIVYFLDTKTSLIDSLIEKTQQKIELLKEKRTSLINEVVTKGLNPNVEMKDSGVEWIGEIPSHWVESQFKYYIKLRHGHQFRDGDFTDEGIKIIKITQLDKGGFLNLSNCSTIDKERLTDFEDILIFENDILMCLTGGTIGKIIKVGKVDEPLLQNYRVGHFSPIDSKSMGNNYMFYLMSSEVIVGQIFYDVRETGQPNIGMEDMNRMRICIPPISEQQQIVEYLDEQTQKIDNTISIEEKRIELLKEYRQSLISEVVTGKRKVV